MYSVRYNLKEAEKGWLLGNKSAQPAVWLQFIVDNSQQLSVKYSVQYSFQYRVQYSVHYSVQWSTV